MLAPRIAHCSAKEFKSNAALILSSGKTPVAKGTDLGCVIDRYNAWNGDGLVDRKMGIWTSTACGSGNATLFRVDIDAPASPAAQITAGNADVTCADISESRNMAVCCRNVAQMPAAFTAVAFSTVDSTAVASGWNHNTASRLLVEVPPSGLPRLRGRPSN